MENKYISSNRYKKTSRNSKKIRNVKSSKKTNGNKANSSLNSKGPNVVNTSKKIKKVKKTKFSFWRFAACILLLIAIAGVSRIMTKEANEPFIPAFMDANNKTNNQQSINMAVYNVENLSDFSSDNIVITELESYVYPMILRIEDDYKLNYEIANRVNKVSNKEYIIEIKDQTEVSVQDIKNELDNIIKSKNKYYYKLKNVNAIEIIDSRKIKILLNEEDEYFAYSLNIPIKKSNTTYAKYNVDLSSNKTKLILNRTENADASIVNNINVISIADEKQAVEMYKNGTIDVFFTNSNVTVKMLGKYDYNIKSYNSGESIFLMFNPNKDIINNNYIRQVIAYSIDRNNILETVSNGSGGVIDLPYIYDMVRYKYDKYAAENLLLTNGFEKINGINTNNKLGKLEFEMLVNEADSEKINVANKIKENLLNIGISINVVPISQTKLNDRINSGQYDMVLSTVYINDNPNINYLKDKLAINNKIEDSMRFIKENSTEDIQRAITNMKLDLSENISCIGIYSKYTYVIYEKELELFKNINYFKLFENYINEASK